MHANYKQMKQYKAILIDWDDTIGDFHGAARQAQQEVYTKHRLQELFPDFEAYWTLYHEHNVGLWEQYGRGEVTKAFLQRDRFLWPICKQMGLDASKPPVTIGGAVNENSALVRMADRMGEDFLTLTNKYFSVLPGAAELVHYLAAKYPLVVVSNGFVEVQYYKIEHSGLKDCFTDIVLSEEVGIQKPQPGIFDVALQRNGWQADEVLMIGDSYSSDVQGAKNAGMDQLWIKPLSPDPSPHGWERGENAPSATYEVHSLAEIYDIV